MALRPLSLPASRLSERDRKREIDKRRGTAKERGYGALWKKRRQAFREAHPLCAECARQGKIVPGAEVDHIIPHRGDMRMFWDEANWQHLCRPHHSAKTARETLNKGKRVIAQGCDAQGWPSDPEHGWNR